MPRKNRPILFVAPGSTSCLESIRALSREQIEYDQYDVSREPFAADQLRQRTGKCEVPTIIWGRDVLSNFTDWQLSVFVQDHR